VCVWRKLQLSCVTIVSNATGVDRKGVCVVRGERGGREKERKREDERNVIERGRRERGERKKERGRERGSVCMEKAIAILRNHCVKI
jgi:hypothetical protein